MKRVKFLQWWRSGIAAPTSVGQAVKLGLVKTFVLTLGLISVAYLAGVGQTREIEFAPKPGESNAGYSMETELLALARKHDCWLNASETNARLYPSHVIYFDSESGRPKLGNFTMTEKALEQVYEGKDHGLALLAFCA